MLDYIRQNRQNMVNTFSKSEGGELQKSGEGSKGGKVIGHTKSGKPIYEITKHPGHNDFNEQDHYDASRVHDKLSLEGFGKETGKDKITGATQFDASTYNPEQIGHHQKQASQHRKQVNKDHFETGELKGRTKEEIEKMIHRGKKR